MTTAEKTLLDLTEHFSVAMLVTRTADGQMRSRPMAVADVEADDTLWLLTDRHSGKMEEIEQDHRVNVTMQSSMRFVSLSGSASGVDDRDKVAELWKEPWKVWFPGGKDDPNLILVKIKPNSGEYWDNSGTSGIRYLIEAGKAYLTGSRPQITDPKIHAKVNL